MDTKIKILIASVLKPVDDVRAYQKIGRSLAQTNKYDVNIIGFNSKMINKAENISFHPIFNFKRNSISRIKASWKYYKAYIKVKPKLIIVSSPELLTVNYIIRILFGTKILYDVQENYRLNLKYSHAYSSKIKPILSLGIKSIEWMSRYFVSGYLLAEEVYVRQLPFLKNRPYEFIFNKTAITSVQHINEPLNFPVKSKISFIYSGTIGKEYGTLEAIKFCQNLYKTNSKVSLTIIGYSADYKYLKKITESIKLTPYISLKGGERPVPNEEILKELLIADIAIMPYEINENTAGRIPTKFYECLALHKPMLIPNHVMWLNMLEKYPAAIGVDFEDSNMKKFEVELSQKWFYKTLPGKEIQWSDEENKLIPFVKKHTLK